MSKELKEHLRQEARARRASIPGPLRLKAAETLAGHIEAAFLSCSIDPGATVGCYLAIGTEINTSPVLRWLSARGYRLALPRTLNPTAPLEFAPWVLNDPLMQDILGFPTPAGLATVTPDALLVPLVGFDRTGSRIGQGSGLYDRTIAQLRRQRPGLPVIGLGFACQELDGIPLEAHDQRLDLVATDKGLVETGPEQAKLLAQGAASL